MQLNRITGIYEGYNPTVVQLGGYSYNILSQRTGVSYGPATGPVASTAVTCTNAGQVASLGHTWTGTSLTLGYTYNTDHQRTSTNASDNTFLPSGIAPGSSTYTTTTSNQYTAVSGTAYTYDHAGNSKQRSNVAL